MSVHACVSTISQKFISSFKTWSNPYGRHYAETDLHEQAENIKKNKFRRITFLVIWPLWLKGFVPGGELDEIHKKGQCNETILVYVNFFYIIL